MKRWDCVGGIFLRVGRWWIGLVRDFPFVVRVPLICGGTDAISTAGAYISKQSDSSPADYIEISEVVSIGGPNPDSEELDATHLRSPARTREYIQSFLVPGECPITVNFIPGDPTHDEVTGLLSEYASGATKNYRITYPDGSKDEFAAYVKNRPTSFNVGEVLRMQFTLRITGTITFTTAP